MAVIGSYCGLKRGCAIFYSSFLPSLPAPVSVCHLACFAPLGGISHQARCAPMCPDRPDVIWVADGFVPAARCLFFSPLYSHTHVHKKQSTWCRMTGVCTSRRKPPISTCAVIICMCTSTKMCPEQVVPNTYCHKSKVLVLPWTVQVWNMFMRFTSTFSIHLYECINVNVQLWSPAGEKQCPLGSVAISHTHTHTEAWGDAERVGVGCYETRASNWGLETEIYQLEPSTYRVCMSLRVRLPVSLC